MRSRPAFARFTLPGLALAAGAILAGCASAPRPVSAERLAGCWVGEDVQPVVRRKTAWRMERRPDGSFTVAFRPLEGPPAPVQTEQGQWRWRDGLYTTITTQVDGRPVDVRNPNYTDTYEVRSLTDTDMSYVHTRLGAMFTAKRVRCEGG
jgi:hypothetical protein